MAWQYYISGGGVTRELKEANGHSLSISRRAGAVSTASWIIDSQPEDAPLWPFGTAVTVSRADGPETEILFRGTITNDQPSADPSDESTPYQASDAWWDMDGEIYRQSRKITLSDGTTGNALYGRSLLGRAADGERMSAAQIISAAIDYAAGIGINIQKGAIDAPVTPPWIETTDKTLSEIIRLALLWQPDAVPWIDHTTSPPTLHVTRRSAMEQTELDFAGLGQCRVRAFPEQQISGCEITYERSNQHGRTVAVDSAGDTSALRCARFTIPLEFEDGVRAPRQEIKTVPLGDYTQLGWWQRIFPWLPNDADITEVMIMPTPPEGFTNILVAGTITDWMRDDLGLSASEYTVSCNAGMEVDGKIFTEKELSRKFTLTNASSRRYVGRFSAGFAEPVPTGVADAFYAAASQLQYGGSIVIEEEECAGGRALMGKAVNVTGARAAWASMKAAVVGVDEDFDSGSTTVTLGPARHLAPQDMIDLLRASRWRHSMQPQNPDDNAASGDEGPADPFGPEDNRSESPGKLSAITLETEDATCAAIIDADDLEDDNPAMFREIEYTGADGKTTRAIFLATEPQADEEEENEDPDGDGSGSSDDCSHDGPPDGGGGGGGGPPENEHDGGHPGSEEPDRDGGHPGKTGPCW